ncbi:glycosyltransferase family 2 protein [soil metagenome]
MQLSVIIINYNVKHFLEQCLASVVKAIKNTNAEVLVIDNNSTDRSKEFFSNKFPEVRFIWQKHNDGFAKANNTALANASGKYILFLNPDTIVAEDTFTKCISFLESKPDAGALGIRMIDGSGKFLKESKRGFPSVATSFFKLAGFAKIFPRSKYFSKYYLGNIDEHSTASVAVLAGAFMMIPQNVLDKTGSFDEDYFMYGEDIDLSYRIQKNGFTNYYFADSTIIHFKGESTQKQKFEYVKTFYNAMRIFVNKHYTRGKARWFSVFIQGAIFFRGSLSAVKLIAASDKKHMPNKIISYFIIGSQTECQEVLEILSSADIRGNHEHLLPATISELPDVILQQRKNDVILCCGELSFKTAIEILQKIPVAIKVRFHAAATKSIVASADKNGKGEVIAIS